MLFNSYTFLLVFLPITLIGYFILGRRARIAAAAWLAVCSLVFYGWWDYRYVPLLLISIVVNYAVGGYVAARAGTSAARRGLTAGVIFDLGLLAYYKYADFFLASTNTALGTRFPLLGVVLPIGISFFTFTQIAFLVDAYAGRVREYRFIHYVLFVTYFPHLIAGPVLHHSEMMPQFDQPRSYRPHLSNFCIGLTVFAIGLGKKVLIADNLAPLAASVFDTPAAAPSLLVAWGGALAYTFQLYFDFSGYSDMAIGLARMFGTRFPLNFNSPYKAWNITEFWRRWHMTLSRFLRDYLYIPLGGNRNGGWRRNLNLMVTMVLGGLWHGAGWGFVAWGALHGVYLVVNHAWMRIRGGERAPAAMGVRSRTARWAGTALTFFCVVIAWVLFRAHDPASAHRILSGMLLQNGFTVPESIASRLGPLWTLLHSIGATPAPGGGSTFVWTWTWIAACTLIVFAFPNTQEIVRDVDRRNVAVSAVPRQRRQWLCWRPTTGWAVATGVLFALGLLAVSSPTDFLYFQF